MSGHPLTFPRQHLPGNKQWNKWQIFFFNYFFPDSYDSENVHVCSPFQVNGSNSQNFHVWFLTVQGLWPGLKKSNFQGIWGLTHHQYQKNCGSGASSVQIPPAEYNLPLLVLEFVKARCLKQGPLLHMCPNSFIWIITQLCFLQSKHEILLLVNIPNLVQLDTFCW